MLVHVEKKYLLVIVIIQLCIIAVLIVAGVVKEMERNNDEEFKPVQVDAQKASKFRNLYKLKTGDTAANPTPTPTTVTVAPVKTMHPQSTDPIHTLTPTTGTVAPQVLSFRRDMFGTDTFQEYGTLDSYTFNTSVPFVPFSGQDHHDGKVDDYLTTYTNYDEPSNNTQTDATTTSALIPKPPPNQISKQIPKPTTKPTPTPMLKKSGCASVPQGRFKGSATKFGVTVTGDVKAMPINKEGGVLNFNVYSDESPPFVAKCDGVAWLIYGDTIELDSDNPCYNEQLTDQGIKITKISYQQDVVQLVIKKKILFFHITISLNMEKYGHLSPDDDVCAI